MSLVKTLGLEVEDDDPNRVRLPASLRGFVVKGSGSGKTVAIMDTVVLRRDSPYAIVVWITKPRSARQELVIKSKEIVDGRALEKYGLPEGFFIFEVDGSDKVDQDAVNELIETVDEAGLRSLVVFDDLLNAHRTTLAFASDLFVSGRHSKCSVLWIGQRIYDAGGHFRTMRLQANMYLLARFSAESEARIFFNESLLGDEAKKALRLWKSCTSRRYGYLLFLPQGKSPWKFRNSGLSCGIATEG